MRCILSLAGMRTGVDPKRKDGTSFEVFPTILSAALIAGMSRSHAQGAGGDVNRTRFGKGTDAQPDQPRRQSEAGQLGCTSVGAPER